MAKTTIFKCSACGHTQAKFSGQCPSCHTWNTIEEVENIVAPSTSGKVGVRASKAATGNVARPINTIAQENLSFSRLSTGIHEVDRVLGGGLVPGGVILLAGEPGIGKSTSSLTIASSLAQTGKKVLYITGEETAGQVAQRAIRIGATNKEGTLGQNLYLLSEGNLQNAIQQLYDIRPDFFVVDSIQTLISNDSESRIGSVTQINEVATEFTTIAKQLNIPALLLGQVLKDTSQIAGPKIIEHLVDTVLMFQSSEDSPLRFLRAKKNRYGSTDEIGVFVHTSEGLIPVEDPSSFFTSPHAEGTTGFANSVTLEGIRVLPIEITSLVTKTKLPNPRKITSGIEHGRALQMQAVADRYVRLSLDAQDVYVATTGGLRLKDSSTDLAVLAAIISSAADVPIPADSVFIGEVSLTGEIRAPREQEKRCQEAIRLGFTKIYTTPFTGDKKKISHEIIPVSTVLDLAMLLKELKTHD